MIPDDQLGDALHAVAERRSYPVALALGVSTPALVREALRRAQEPATYARYPDVCRRLLARQEAARDARSAARLTIRSEV